MANSLPSGSYSPNSPDVVSGLSRSLFGSDATRSLSCFVLTRRRVILICPRFVLPAVPVYTDLDRLWLTTAAAKSVSRRYHSGRGAIQQGEARTFHSSSLRREDPDSHYPALREHWLAIKFVVAPVLRPSHCMR